MNLPCPECSEHAKETFLQARRNGIKLIQEMNYKYFGGSFIIQFYLQLKCRKMPKQSTKKQDYIL